MLWSSLRQLFHNRRPENEKAHSPSHVQRRGLMYWWSDVLTMRMTVIINDRIIMANSVEQL